MVTVLPAVEKRSFGAELGRALGAGGAAGFSEAMQEKRKLRELAEMARAKTALNPLQESQRQLAEQKLQNLQSQQELFKSLTSEGKPRSFSEELSGDYHSPLQQVPESKLSQLAAFAGQPGETGVLGQIAKNELEQRRRHEELSEKKRLTSPEFKREQQLASSQAQTDVKYNQQVQENSKQLELKEKSLDRLEQLNKKGVTGKPWEKLAEKWGLVNITSDGRREFASEVKTLITDIRSILGGQFSQFEFQTILNAYPSADFSKEANEAIIRNQKEFVNIKKKEAEFARELKKENGGKIPEDFQAKVNEKVAEYALSKLPEIKKNTQKIMAEEYGITPGNVLMLDPNGEPLDVSPDKVEYYESLGASLP